MKDYEMTEGERKSLREILLKMFRSQFEGEVLPDNERAEEKLFKALADRVAVCYELIAWEDATGQFHGPMFVRDAGLYVGAADSENGFEWIEKHDFKFLFAFAPLSVSKDDELMKAPLPVAVCYEKEGPEWMANDLRV